MNFQKNRGNILFAWWWSIDRYILYSILLLLGIGFTLVMAASPPIAARYGYNDFYFVQKQILFIMAGVTIMVSISLLPAIATRRFAIFFFFIFFILLVLVEFMGYETKGAKRWISLGFMSIQPSELLKPCFAVLTAWLITRRNTDKKFPGFTISTIIFSLIAFLLIRQPNFAMTITIAAIWSVQMMVGGLNIYFIIGLGIAGIAGVVAAYNYLPHVHHRIDLFLSSSAGTSENYQTEKSLEAFNNGGVFGTGAGEGIVKQILPDAHTDFIFSVAGEEFGLWLPLVIISLYSIIVFRCLYRAYYEKDLFIMLAVTGLSMQLFFQAVINMGVATNLIPNTGIPLPFISYGGSSMVSVSAVVGMILSLTRKKFG